MGKKSGPSAPPPPDPVATAQAQGAINKDTAETQARLNRVNEYTPYGSMTYSSTGDSTAPYQRNISLSPGQQALYNSQLSSETKLADLAGTLTDRVSPNLAKPLDLSTAPAAGQAGFTGSMPTLADPRAAHAQFDSSGLTARGQFDTSQLGDMAQLDYSDLPQQGDLDFSGLGDMPQADDATRLRVEQALMERMRPYQEQDEERLRTRLANTGFDMSSQGYGRSMDSHNRAVNDARLGAIAQGGNEMQRMFGMGMAARQQGANELGQEYAADTQNRQLAAQLAGNEYAAGMQNRQQGLTEMGQQYDADNRTRALAYGEAQDEYQRGVDERMRGLDEDQARYLAEMQGRQQSVAEQDATFGQQNQLRQQGIQEQVLQRNQPLNEIAALLGTGQVQQPNFGAVPQVGVASPDLMGATYANYQGQLQNHQQQQQQRNAMMGGLFGLGSAAVTKWSDRRLKSNIRRIGTWRGYPAYSYEIFGAPDVGVMADEVNQDAVTRHSSGYDMVDYARVR